MKGKEFGIINISKSGTTTEPAIAFRLLKELLEEKVEKKKPTWIVAITDESKEHSVRWPLGGIQDLRDS